MDREAIVTIGSKEGLAHLMLATLDRGDTVLVPNPSYPIHIYGAIIAGADIRSVRMTPGVDFFAEAERAIRELIPKPKMMILGFPSNPTAKCVELDFFEKIIALAKQHGILVVHDLAYADITFDGWKAPSIMQVPGAKDVAVEFFTMSKSYNMAGWRIGFMVGNPELVNALARIKSYHDYGTFTPLQVAAIAATRDYAIPATATHKAFYPHNLNRLLWTYPGATGLKTGLTDNAGGCMLATATRNGRHLVAVVLNATLHSTDDATALLNYGFSVHPTRAFGPWVTSPN